MSVVARTANSNGENRSPSSVAPVDGAGKVTAGAATTESAAAAAAQDAQGTASAKVTPITEKVRREAAALRNALAFTQVVGVLMRSSHYTGIRSATWNGW
jgi:hypothetical protein